MERVGPGAAHEGVVAAAAVQHIVAGASGQAVVPAGADDVLDVCKRIAGGVAARCRSRSEIDGDCGRTGVVERVVARSAINAVGASAARKDVVVVAAHERVGAAATAQRIGTVAAKEQVGVAVSGDAVGKDGAAHIRNIGQDVALGVATGARASEQVNRDGEVGRIIIGNVADAPATLESVRSGAANESVSAPATIQKVVVAVACQQVSLARAGDIANADEHIILGVAAKRRAGGKVDCHRAGSAVVGRVDTASTHEGVGAGSARQCVRACATIEQIVQAVADQPIIARGAVHILDIGEGVALGVAPGCRARAEVDGNRRRSRIVDRVGTGAAVDAVGGCPTGEHVVTVAAVERVGAAAARYGVGVAATIEDVGAAIASQDVGLGRARQVEDPNQPVAQGVAG